MDNYKRFFSYIDRKEPNQEILNSVFDRIKAEKKRHIVAFHIPLFGISFLSACTVFMYSFQESLAESARSGFSQFLSFFWTDFGTAAAYWKDFAISIVESFPAFGALAIFGALCVILFSMRALIRDFVTLSSFRPEHKIS